MSRKKPTPGKPADVKIAKVPLIPKEISWLSFNERVLQEAEDSSNPLLERIKFLGIFSNNLDEFYRVRVANLQRIEQEVGPKARVAGTMVRMLIKQIRARVLRQAEQFNEITKQLFLELEEQGVHILDENRLRPEQAESVKEYFQNTVRPRLVPIICHRNRELPAFRDQFIYLAVELTVPSRKTPIYAFIEVPTDSLSRFHILPKSEDGDYIVLLEDVIRLCLGEIFAQFEPTQCRAWTVKITRDSELELRDDLGEAYVERVHRGLRKRRTGAPVRMVYDKGLPLPFLRFLVQKMKFGRDDALIPGQRYHNFKDFMRFPTLGREHLTRPPVAPISHPALRGHRNTFDAIARRDVLLHFPYHGFVTIVDLLREAAIDPHVTHIRMTVYRVSQTSSVLNALINAVRNGKRVVVVIELLARFDEENNLDWVDRLRDEGVEVITGVRGLKVHAKLLLISRRESKVMVRYAAIGTGNFHEETARIYSDHCLLTRDPGITTDVFRVFEFFRNNYKAIDGAHLVVSPYGARKHWRQLIRQEARNARSGRPAHIWIKLNNFDDVKLARALYAASRAGVDVRLIVRSMCSLVPNYPGYSDNVRAISLVGRFLEHSRFFVFGNGGTPLVYLTSGDWMARNFDARVEVACPVRDEGLAAQLIDYFKMQWEDTANSRIWDRELSNTRSYLLSDGPLRNTS
ncbi:MAG: polyphosphate kinase 1 [Polyangiaceae bacterium]